MRLDRLAPLLALDGIEWIGLQREIPAVDADAFARWQARHPALATAIAFDDFAATAACIATLDRVVSVDTAVAHLAGALGKPLSLLLPHAADFRWGQRRLDTPWYPTARLHRAPARDAWDAVVDEVRATLADAAR